VLCACRCPSPSPPPLPPSVLPLRAAQEDVAGCPSFAQVAPEWRAFLEGCDLLGYNAKKFDVPLLRCEAGPGASGCGACLACP
jgi:hypothetical protein